MASVVFPCLAAAASTRPSARLTRTLGACFGMQPFLVSVTVLRSVTAIKQWFQGNAQGEKLEIEIRNKPK